MEFKATNNIAGYEGLVSGLRIAKTLGVRRLLVRGDSQLVAKQVQKEYSCNDHRMAEYLAEVQKMEKHFDGFEVRYEPRLDNKDADHLAWIASSRSPVPEDVILEKLSTPSAAIQSQGLPSAGAEVMLLDMPNEYGQVEDWRVLIRNYLKSNLPPDDSPEAQRMK